MDLTTWVLLVLFLVYLLFNIKNVYASILRSFADNGAKWTLGWMGFVIIPIAFGIVGVVAPNYSWIPQWAFNLYIVGFFIYRFIYGVPKEDREG